MESNGFETDKTLTLPPGGLVLNEMDHTDGVQAPDVNSGNFDSIQKSKSKPDNFNSDVSVLQSDKSGRLSAEPESSSGVSSGGISGSENSFDAGTDIAPILNAVQCLS
jgi:hypothetical protein